VRLAAAIPLYVHMVPTSREFAEGRPKDKGGPRRRRAVFEDALEVIQRTYDDQGLTVDSLSKRLFVSRRQLQRAFTEAGTSVQESLHAVRMERAAELLHDTSMPVAEIARSVGYRHSAQFAKAFRRYHGVPPSQWRRRAGGKHRYAKAGSAATRLSAA